MNRRLVLASFALCAALAASLPLALQAQEGAKKAASGPRPRVSPHDTISAVIGGRGGPRVTITYGRPFSAKGGQGEARKIWGGLVPWDKPDRLGADEATTLTTEVPLVIGSTTIPAGGYVLYIIASENGTSQLAFSSHLGKWGIPVDDKHDVARVNLEKSTLDHSVDQLTLSLAADQATGGGVLKIQWETTQFALPFTIQK